MLLLVVSFITTGKTQNVITVAPGTVLALSSGTTFSMDGLSVTPATAFTLNGITLTRTASVTHPTVNNHASRVFQFSGNTNPFTGIIRFYYQDAELNGIAESSLRINIHDGTSWNAVNSATNDAVNNYVESVALSNQVMNELALADLLFPLPVKWGLVTGYRESRSVKIGWRTLQEENVSHFSVERSLNAINWTTIEPGLTAHNTLSPQQYSYTDNEYNPHRLFYRIKQTDMDGRFSYSRVIAIEPDGSSDMVVYPNPVTNVFYISNINPELVKQVRLYNIAGIQVKAWNTIQPSYDIQSLPVGIYQIQLLYTDGQTGHAKINKQ